MPHSIERIVDILKACFTSYKHGKDWWIAGYDDTAIWIYAEPWTPRDKLYALVREVVPDKYRIWHSEHRIFKPAKFYVFKTYPNQVTEDISAMGWADIAKYSPEARAFIMIEILYSVHHLHYPIDWAILEDNFKPTDKHPAGKHINVLVTNDDPRTADQIMAKIVSVGQFCDLFVTPVTSKEHKIKWTDLPGEPIKEPKFQVLGVTSVWDYERNKYIHEIRLRIGKPGAYAYRPITLKLQSLKRMDMSQMTLLLQDFFAELYF